jgi:hypothetical protein
MQSASASFAEKSSESHERCLCQESPRFSVCTEWSDFLRFWVRCRQSGSNLREPEFARKASGLPSTRPELENDHGYYPRTETMPSLDGNVPI